MSNLVTKPSSDDSPDTDATTAAVAICQLGKRFGDRWVLRHTNLRIEIGERVALMGESGTGKSTLLNIIAGLEGSTEGSVHVLGSAMHELDIDASAQVRRSAIGFVFQAFHLLPHLRVWQNVALPLLLQHVPQAQARETVAQVLARLSLATRSDDWPSTLSGGEQQRVALARALVHRPKLLLADEPTGNLDPRIAADAITLMNETVAEAGATLLLVTHSQAAAQACSRSIHLADCSHQPNQPKRP